MKKSRDQRGFALLIVVLMTALFAITAAALLDLVDLDLDMLNDESNVVRAQQLAEWGGYQQLDDVNLPTFLPNVQPGAGHSNQLATVTGMHSAGGSQWVLPSDSYASSVALLRVASLPNTSLNLRFGVYELLTNSTVLNGRATASVGMEVVRMVGGKKKGTISGGGATYHAR